MTISINWLYVFFIKFVFKVGVVEEMLNFREITPADDEAIARIIRVNLKARGLDIPGTVYFDTILDHLSDFYLNTPQSFYYILQEDEEVIGGVGLSVFEGIENTAELQKLYLSDEVKGRGLGKDLISHIENKAREMGFKKMYLETHTNLDIAIKLYEKVGYIQIDRPDCVNHSTMNRFYIKEL